MARVPPIVLYRVNGGAAYLIAWQQHPDRTWWARIAWVECEDARQTTTTTAAVRGTAAWVNARDVVRISGQDYSKVPRRKLDPQRPRDTTDSRDPGRTSRAQDRARLDRRRPDPPEPDF